MQEQEEEPVNEEPTDFSNLPEAVNADRATTLLNQNNEHLQRQEKKVQDKKDLAASQQDPVQSDADAQMTDDAAE